MTSMTAYAYKELSCGSIFISVEIKSVNSRFLDLNINLPPFLGRLEQELRSQCSGCVLRGKVDVYIRVKDFSPDTKIYTDIQAAKIYADALKKIAGALNIDLQEIPLSLIVSREDILSVRQEYDMDKYRSLIKPVFTEALNIFCSEKEREGKNLKKDMLLQLKKIEQCASVFRQAVPEMEKYFKNLIIKRFNELLGERADEQRIMSEIAAMLVKYTINEEVVRLLSHIEALKDEIQHNLAPGRKIDFICQELNREINTIGSKNQMTEIGKTVITAKDALENIREQSRNIE